ncbi:MAG: DUF1697 domain-containing protein [Myxococcaceae bacterium]
MNRYALLLRGVNVGTQNSLPMAALREGKSKLALVLSKLKLRGAVTARNWNTVQKLKEMLAAEPD